MNDALCCLVLLPAADVTRTGQYMPYVDRMERVESLTDARPVLLDLPTGQTPDTPDSTHTGTGPPVIPVGRDWEVTAWASHRHPGVLWRLQRDGSVVPSGGINTQRIISTAEAADLVNRGVLYPAEVSALPPVIREVTRFREHSEYLQGPTACLDGGCDHPLSIGCPEVRRVLATASEAIRLQAVATALEVLDRSVADLNDLDDLDVALVHPDTAPDQATAGQVDDQTRTAAELAQLRGFVDAVRQILRGDHDDDDM